MPRVVQQNEDSQETPRIPPTMSIPLGISVSCVNCSKVLASDMSDRYTAKPLVSAENRCGWELRCPVCGTPNFFPAPNVLIYTSVRSQEFVDNLMRKLWLQGVSMNTYRTLIERIVEQQGPMFAQLTYGNSVTELVEMFASSQVEQTVAAYDWHIFVDAGDLWDSNVFYHAYYGRAVEQQRAILIHFGHLISNPLVPPTKTVIARSEMSDTVTLLMQQLDR